MNGNDDFRLVEFYDPQSDGLGPTVEMPAALLTAVQSLDGKRATVREAIDAIDQAEPGCTIYDQGDWLAIGFGERVEIMPGTTLHKHNWRAIRMRPVAQPLERR